MSKGYIPPSNTKRSTPEEKKAIRRELMGLRWDLRDEVEPDGTPKNKQEKRTK